MFINGSVFAVFSSLVILCGIIPTTDSLSMISLCYSQFRLVKAVLQRNLVYSRDYLFSQLFLYLLFLIGCCLLVWQIVLCSISLVVLCNLRRLFLINFLLVATFARHLFSSVQLFCAYRMHLRSLFVCLAIVVCTRCIDSNVNFVSMSIRKLADTYISVRFTGNLI